MERDHHKSLLWLRLSLTPGLGPVQAGRLLERFGSVEALCGAPASELGAVEGVRQAVARSILDAETRDRAEQEWEKCRACGIRALGLDDPGYPPPLLEIPAPPLVLYIKGNYAVEDEDAVAMVGCRNPDPYGESMAVSLAAGLARQGVTVVSGLARGIDGAAQDGALKAGGRTIAVLGTGVDTPYPAEHVPLYERIPAAGAVVSEFPLGTGPDARNFPRRNRIISGLSRGVIMVQAMSRRSGALITVRHALEQGREVFAVPGNAGSRGGRVGNELIKEGARLVETAADVLLHLRPLSISSESEDEKSEELESARTLPNLQSRLYALVPLPNEGTADMDGLARQAGVSAAEASTALLELELAGLVRALPGKRYVRLRQS